MVSAKTSLKFRKAHRYLGLFLGIQFLFWTISGLYFSWTNLDEIHGDQFKKNKVQKEYKNLISPSDLDYKDGIKTISLRDFNNVPYYWINSELLVNAINGSVKDSITKEEAISISNENILDQYKISLVEKIYEVGNHHEYRGRPLPAFVISYEGTENLKSYVIPIIGNKNKPSIKNQLKDLPRNKIARKSFGEFFSACYLSVVPHTDLSLSPASLREILYWCFLVPNRDRVPCSLR